MNFVIAKNLSYTSSDFKITDKHFLFNNLEDIDGNYYYLYRDRDMNEVDHFIPYKPKWGHTLHGRGTTGQMFTWNESTKQSFLVRPFSNQIYEFTPAGKLQLSFEIDFGNKTIPDRIGEKDFNPGRSPFIYIEDFFDFNHFKMMSFLEKNTRYYTLILIWEGNYICRKNQGFANLTSLFSPLAMRKPTHRNLPGRISRKIFESQRSTITGDRIG